ncbi:DUF6777 domain-containing protein [Streptomyces sp. NPDC055078]
MRWPAAAALSVTLTLGPLLAGCGGDSVAVADPDEEVVLQPAAARGPDPYTASSARAVSAPPPGEAAAQDMTSRTPTRGHTLRTLSGATPGLYGGTRDIGSCDMGAQLALLRRDTARADAFARGAGISRADLPGFLRELTPVVLRADTRVTNHAYRNRSADAYQAVLQAGTAVLVDRHGAPRVRCACGNPLKPPVAAKGGVIHQGRPWGGYQAGRVVVVKPTPQVMDSLLIVNVGNSTWIDRRTGSDGEQDRRPEVIPPVTPDDIYTYPPAPDPGDTAVPDPADPTATDCATPPGTGEPDAATAPGGCPPEVPSDPGSLPPVDPPGESAPLPADPDAPTDPDTPSDEDIVPSDPELVLPPEEEATEPDTFAG